MGAKIIDLIICLVVGGAIGLITNGLAIKMMFRPFNPVYLDKKNQKLQLPFTPGLIPKEKSRLAHAIGRIVGNKLLDIDTLKNALLSENIHEKVIEKVTGFVNQYATAEYSISEFLQEKGYLEKLDDKEVVIKDKLGNHINKKIVEFNVGKKVVEIAMQELAKKLSPMFMSMIIKTLNVEHLQEKVNTIAQEKVPEYIGIYLDNEYSKIKDMSLGEIVTKLIEFYPNYTEKIWELYQKIIEEKASDIIREFNISQIVEDKINEFDLQELENLINEIADRELKALILLGGGLGAIMGIINFII